MKNKIICICGKCATGKSTLIKELSKYPDFKRIVSYTTRPQRENESLKDYHFCTEEEFHSLMENEITIGYTSYQLEEKTHHYTFLEKDFTNEKNNVIVCNPDGIKKLMLTHKKDLFVIYMESSLGERISNYLLREKEKNYKKLLDRLLKDEKDFLDFDNVLKTIPHLRYKNTYSEKDIQDLAKNINDYFNE